MRQHLVLLWNTSVEIFCEYILACLLLELFTISVQLWRRKFLAIDQASHFFRTLLQHPFIGFFSECWLNGQNLVTLNEKFQRMFGKREEGVNKEVSVSVRRWEFQIWVNLIHRLIVCQLLISIWLSIKLDVTNLSDFQHPPKSESTDIEIWSFSLLL